MSRIEEPDLTPCELPADTAPPPEWPPRLGRSATKRDLRSKFPSRPPVPRALRERMRGSTDWRRRIAGLLAAGEE
jgi:hypothetical protein